MKYLKNFDTTLEYEEFVENDIEYPNVSYLEDSEEVKYLEHEPPIAPLGAVQVFANPECTQYANGQSNIVYVRLNQDFGFGEEKSWGENWNDAETVCSIMTPNLEDPQNSYEITLWVDFSSIDRDNTQPFTSGEVVKCYQPEQYFDPTFLQNPQVIFYNSTEPK